MLVNTMQRTTRLSVAYEPKGASPSDCLGNIDDKPAHSRYKNTSQHMSDLIVLPKNQSTQGTGKQMTPKLQ
jgi:hypothetical protein